MAQHLPQRGDDVEAWLKALRDTYTLAPNGLAYCALDEALDAYRLAADTGTPVSWMVAAPHGPTWDPSDEFQIDPERVTEGTAPRPFPACSLCGDTGCAGHGAAPKEEP